MIPPADSYSALERRLIGPARRLLLAALAPLIHQLARLRISPNAISFSQVVLGGLAVYLIPIAPRVAFVVFVLAISMDGVDGALARATGQASRFGALFDQYCDHIREVIVVAGLALFGPLNPFVAALYGLTYPAFNLTLYLCNLYRDPLPVAIKSYLVVYPAIFLFLWFGVDWLTPAVGLSILLMWAAITVGLYKPSRAMPRT